MTAKSIESGHPPIAGVLSLSGALRVFDEIGEAAIVERINYLTNYLHQQLEAIGIDLDTIPARGALAGITILPIENNEAVAAELAKQNVFVAPRGIGLRIATHLYNNEADIDAFVDALQSVL